MAADWPKVVFLSSLHFLPLRFLNLSNEAANSGNERDPVLSPNRLEAASRTSLDNLGFPFSLSPSLPPYLPLLLSLSLSLYLSVSSYLPLALALYLSLSFPLSLFLSPTLFAILYFGT